MLRKIKIFYFVLFFSPVLLKAIVYDFETIKSSSLSNSFKIQHDKIDVKIAKENINLAKTELYPAVGVSSSIERSRKYNEYFSPSYIGEEAIVQSSGKFVTSSAYINYDLLKLKSTHHSINAARQNHLVADFSQRLREKEIVLQLLETYSFLRILNFKLKNYEKMQTLYEELYLVSKKLYENGVMAKPNFIKSAHDLAEITTTISSTKEEKLTQLALIKKLSGMDIGRDDEFLPLSKSKGVQKDTLFENSINSMRVKMLIIQKEQELKSTKAKLLPSLSIYGKYDLYGGSQDSYQHAFDDYRRNGYRLGIHFSWNIFGGFRVQNELKIKRLELLQAKLAYEEAKDEYESEQLLIKSQIEVEQNKLNSVKDSTKHTGEILELSERLFSEGEGDKITQLVSKINLYRTFIDEHEAKERLSYSHKKREIMNEGNL